MPMSTEYLAVPEVPKVIPVKEATIRAWILHRRIPYVKLGRRVFIRRGDLERLIERSIVPARPQRGEA
jgi:excisionase family DNA binding protein